MARAVVLNSEAQYLLTSLLKEVSRSFYLTLRVLPAAVRPQIGLAYLLARTSDTLADTDLVPVEARLHALADFARQIREPAHPIPTPARLTQQQGNLAERVLLEKIPATLDVLRRLASPDRDLVVQVLNTIISGQELDLRRFAAASRDRIVALQAPQELDDYTYRVAGCVGEFWTRITLAHLFPSASIEIPRFLEDGVRFGKGLQLVNILRDVPADLAQGRCYLPASDLAAAGLAPRDLLNPCSEPAFRPLYDRYLADAERKLLCGWRYTNTVPRRQVRVRLACAWPVLIGLETIRLLKSANVLEPGRRVKVSRRQVRRLLARSVFYYPWAAAWSRLAGSLETTPAATPDSFA